MSVSFVFVAWLWWYLGGLDEDPAAQTLANAKALEFVTGYLVEKALAVDNIFVFLMLFTYFSVPPDFQKRVLMIGILGALVLRAIMILLGGLAYLSVSLGDVRFRSVPCLYGREDVVGGRSRTRP